MAGLSAILFPIRFDYTAMRYLVPIFHFYLFFVVVSNFEYPPENRDKERKKERTNSLQKMPVISNFIY